MKRFLQLLGLLLIAVLSIEAEAVRAQEPPENCMTHTSGCVTCVEDSGCMTWTCPIGHPKGVGVVCF